MYEYIVCDVPASMYCVLTAHTVSLCAMSTLACMCVVIYAKRAVLTLNFNGRQNGTRGG